MAKEKHKKFDEKHVKINKEDLTITKIGEMTNAEQSSLFVVAFFGILFLFIVALPLVVNLVKGNNEKMDYSVTTPKKNEEKPEKPEEEKPNDISYYLFQSSLSIPLEEGITVHHFTLDNQTVSFTITNNNASKFYFSKHNYFMELYSEENTLLERIILLKDSISTEESINYAYKVSESTATNMKKIMFVEKEISDYPNIALEKNEAGEEALVCIKDYDMITYTFKNQELISIQDVVNFPNTGNEYEKNYNDWKNKNTAYGIVSGVTSTFIDSGNGFIVTTVIHLEDAKVKELENEYYYEKGTPAKVVKFEMEARGFQCK